MTKAGHFWLRGIAAFLALAAIGVALTERQMRRQGGELPVQAAELPLVAANPAIAQLPQLFSSENGNADSQDSSLPELIGVAGRLPDDAEVLVRIAPGKSKTVRTGESALGWTVIAITADSVTFERDGIRRVAKLKPEL